jgi:hypothetical protein
VDDELGLQKVTIQLILASGGPAGGQPFEKVAKHVFIIWYPMDADVF